MSTARLSSQAAAAAACVPQACSQQVPQQSPQTYHVRTLRTPAPPFALREASKGSCPSIQSASLRFRAPSTLGRVELQSLKRPALLKRQEMEGTGRIPRAGLAAVLACCHSIPCMLRSRISRSCQRCIKMHASPRICMLQFARMLHDPCAQDVHKMAGSNAPSRCSPPWHVHRPPGAENGPISPSGFQPSSCCMPSGSVTHAAHP